MTALRVRDLRLPFGDAPGLEPLSFEVERGRRLVVLGPSGAGKTTLLRGIAGLAPASGGAVEVEGRDVTALPPERRGVVYLHQTPLLFPHLDVFENVAFPLRVRGETGRSLRARVERVLARVRLEGFGARAPQTLSGGQRHRVALARALAARPAALLLDEPLAALDPALREEVRQSILDAQEEEGPATVLVTHDLDEAGLLGDHIGVLLDRRIAQLATPEELFAHPASLAVARFLSFPNRISGRVRPDGAFESALGVVHPGRRAPPGPAVAVFRADAVTLHPDGLPVRVTGVRHRPLHPTLVARAGEQELEIAIPPGHALPPLGGELRVRIDPERVLLYPPDEVNSSLAPG